MSGGWASGVRYVSAAREALGSPYAGLFERVLSRAVDRGVVSTTVDIVTLAEVFPAVAYHRTAAQGLLVGEEDVVQVVDAVLLPALLQSQRPLR